MLKVCHVKVIGRPHTPVLDVDISEAVGNSVLKYLPRCQRCRRWGKRASMACFCSKNQAFGLEGMEPRNSKWTARACKCFWWWWFGWGHVCMIYRGFSLSKNLYLFLIIYNVTSHQEPCLWFPWADVKELVPSYHAAFYIYLCLRITCLIGCFAFYNHQSYMYVYYYWSPKNANSATCFCIICWISWSGCYDRRIFI